MKRQRGRRPSVRARRRGPRHSRRGAIRGIRSSGLSAARDAANQPGDCAAGLRIDSSLDTVLDETAESARALTSARYAAMDEAGNPMDFDFPGFTHDCTKERNRGHFRLGRKPVAKRMTRTRRRIREALRRRMHANVEDSKVAWGGWMAG